MNKTNEELLVILNAAEDRLNDTNHEYYEEKEMLLHDFDDNYYGEGSITLFGKDVDIESVWTDEQNGLIIHVNTDGLEADVYFCSLLLQNQKLVIEAIRNRLNNIK